MIPITDETVWTFYDIFWNKFVNPIHARVVSKLVGPFLTRIHAHGHKILKKAS